MTRQRFESLDSLRGVAALFIALVHFPAIFAGAQFAPLRHAYLLTNLFFMLSGFILMSAYGARLSSWEQWRSFAGVRTKRLVPLHLLTTAAVLLSPYVAWVTHVGLAWVLEGSYAGDMPRIAVPLEHLMVHVLMLQGFGLLGELVLNFPAWSMGAIFFCSLLLALVLVAAPGARARATAFSLLALIGFGVIALRSPTYMGASHDWGIFRALSSFFAGAVLQMAWQRWRAAEVTQERWAVSWQAAALVLFFFYATWARTDSPRSLLAPAVMAVLVWTFASDHGDFARVLAARPFKWLSQRSYSLFMNQAALLFIGHQAEQWTKHFNLRAFDATMVGTAAAVLYLGFLLVVSNWTYRHVEQRFGRGGTPAAKKATTVVAGPRAATA